MIGDDTAWRAAYANVPLVGDDSWKQNLADYLGDLLDNLLNLSTYVSPGVPPYPAFLFDRSTFAGALTGAPGAWVVDLQAAFTAVIPTSPFTILPLTVFGAATPAETFSTPGVAVADPPSITLGVAKIGELVSSPQVGDPLLSDFPVKMRAAFLLLTYTVTGTNSLPVPTPMRAVE
jgi:hypothetical protein